MLDLGFSMALTKYLARAAARGSSQMLLPRLARCSRPSGATRARLLHSAAPTEPLGLAAGAPDAGLVAAAAADGWSPLAAVQSALVLAHDASGLPWWATIAAGTLAMRLVVLPAVLYQQRQHARFAHLRPLLRAVSESCQHIESRPKRQAAALAGMWRVCVENGVHPLSLFAGSIVQLPVFLVCIFSVRRLLASARDAAAAGGDAGGSSGFAEGGALWFADLTAADPTATLPLLTLGTFLLTTEAANRPAAAGGAGAEQPARGLPLWLDYLRKRLQDLGVIALPAVAALPSGVFMYWLPNNLISLAQSAALRSEWARARGRARGQDGAGARARAARRAAGRRRDVPRHHLRGARGRCGRARARPAAPPLRLGRGARDGGRGAAPARRDEAGRAPRHARARRRTRARRQAR